LRLLGSRRRETPSESFHRDPLTFLTAAFAWPAEMFPAGGADSADEAGAGKPAGIGAAGRMAVWLPGRQLCVADPVAARAILANPAGLYQEHSDFFHTRRGAFGPRVVQVEMGRAARDLLNRHIAARAGVLAGTIERELAPASLWPDAGNRLVFRHLSAAIAAPESPTRLHRTVERMVERSVLAGARERGFRPARVLYRYLALRQVAQAIDSRRAAGGPAVDLLGVVAAAADRQVAATELAEIFVSFLFAIAGSLGFVLGWSLYLLGTRPEGRNATEPAWVVREALRLWPVAWMLGRRPARRHEVTGESVTPEDQVVVCPYQVHRNPAHWRDPHAFRPERWAAIADHNAFLPFGWGPHRCVAAALSMQLVEDILRLLVARYRLKVTPLDDHPFVGPALAPPRFRLDLTA
jgi:cytochrome P450